MGKVHNHGPDEGRGLDCGERVLNGELVGHCLAPTTKASAGLQSLAPAGTMFARGAFKRMEIKNVPVTFEGARVGTAYISEDGESINMELETGHIPSNIRQAFLYNIADGLSLGVDYRPAVATKTTDWDQQAKKRR